MHPHEIEYVIENLRVLRALNGILLEGTSLDFPFAAVMEDSDTVGMIRVFDGTMYARVMDREKLSDHAVKAILEGFDTEAAWKYANDTLPTIFKIEGALGFAKVHVEGSTYLAPLKQIEDCVLDRTNGGLVVSVPHAGWEVGLLHAAATGLRLRLR